MPQFSLAPLKPEQVAQAYPLVRMALPQLELGEWHNYAAAMASSGGGVLTLLAPSGAIHALAAYRAVPNLHHGRALIVELFVAFELSRKAPARAALVDGLHLLAEGLGCQAVLFTAESQGLLTASRVPPELAAIPRPSAALEAADGRGEPLARSG
jgi:hypothetical protein